MFKDKEDDDETEELLPDVEDTDFGINTDEDDDEDEGW